MVWIGGMTGCVTRGVDKTNNQVFKERGAAYSLYLTQPYQKGDSLASPDSLAFLNEKGDTLRFKIKKVFDLAKVTPLGTGNGSERYEEIWSAIVLQHEEITIELALGTAFADNGKDLENYAAFVYNNNDAVGIEKSGFARLGSMTTFVFEALPASANFVCSDARNGVAAWSFAVEKEKGIHTISYTLPVQDTSTAAETHTLRIVQ